MAGSRSSPVGAACLRLLGEARRCPICQNNCRPLACRGREVSERKSSEQLQQLTPQSISTRSALLTELEEIRRYGYALNCGESEPGLRGVAVAVLGPGNQATVGITLAAPDYRLPADALPRVAAAVRKTADRVAEELH
jgi:DNA-binding IclR family transcriptional regulator